MRLNAAFLVGFIFLLSACAPLQPEPGVTFKDFNSKSALNMRGYIIPAGMYKDVGVSRYETRQQKLQRERGEAQPTNGWVFYYEKDGVMISETELLALQSQRQNELQVAQNKARQTVNNRSISQTNQRKIVQSSNVQTPEISSSNGETRATGAEAIRLVCHPVHDKIINKSDRRVLEFYASSHPALRVTIQGSKLSAEATRSENVVVMNGADFVSQREVTHHTGRTSTVFEYKINSRYNGDPSFNRIRIEWWDQHTVNLTRTIVPSTLPFNVEHLYGCSEL